MSFYAMSEPNEPVDKNAPTDISHLTYLHGCNVLVTNDQFMKRAFEFMYRGQSKQCLTCDELIEMLDQMDSSGR